MVEGIQKHLILHRRVIIGMERHTFKYTKIREEQPVTSIVACDFLNLHDRVQKRFN